MDYIQSLESKLGVEETVPMEEEEAGGEPPFPAVYESGDDFEKAGDLKQRAADLKSSGDWEGGR